MNGTDGSGPNKLRVQRTTSRADPRLKVKAARHILGTSIGKMAHQGQMAGACPFLGKANCTNSGAF